MKKERRPYLGNPYDFVLPKRKPVVHPVITKWEDFTELDKNILQKVKNTLIEKLGECRITAFGSKVNGNWDEKSDYDIIVYKDVDFETMSSILKHNWEGLAIDVMFNKPGYDSKLLEIEIP
jgi:predicted nucleotidyltransferase